MAVPIPTNAFRPDATRPSAFDGGHPLLPMLPSTSDRPPGVHGTKLGHDQARPLEPSPQAEPTHPSNDDRQAATRGGWGLLWRSEPGHGLGRFAKEVGRGMWLGGVAGWVWHAWSRSSREASGWNKALACQGGSPLPWPPPTPTSPSSPDCPPQAEGGHHNQPGPTPARPSRSLASQLECVESSLPQPHPS